MNWARNCSRVSRSLSFISIFNLAGASLRILFLCVFSISGGQLFSCVDVVAVACWQAAQGELGGGLCPFSIALLLSVARIQRYEEQVSPSALSLCLYCTTLRYCHLCIV